MKNKKGNNNLGFFFKILPIVTIILTLEMACAQEPVSTDVSRILTEIGTDAVSLDMMDMALPRLSDDTVVLLLRGGEPVTLRGGDLSKESFEKKCFVIGAYIHAAIWDWTQFNVTSGKDTLFDAIKFAMEHYLVNINHRLHSIGAPEELVLQVDQVKTYFSASGQQARPDFGEIDQFLNRLANELRLFTQKRDGYQRIFAMAKLLVWQAQLANLCLPQDNQKATYLREVMNQRFLALNDSQFRDLVPDILGTKNDDGTQEIMQSLVKIENAFPLQNQTQVQSLRDEIMHIFGVFDLKFPSLKV